jgi:putative DNA methylase
MVKTRRKLIEVVLPLEAISDEGSRRKRKAPAGYPTAIHKWWAQRPLAAARAVIFAQMVDDPSSHPDKFPTEAEQTGERERLFGIIRQLVLWENTNNEALLAEAREEIHKSWRGACADNRDHPEAATLFNPDKLPPFFDPFAGGGSLPLEAQRLGLEAHASDLNPVAVLINKALIEIPPKFAGMPPVNPEARKKLDHSKSWQGAAGLAEDVRYYGRWMRDEAEKRIGHLYPKVDVTAEMAKSRPDLKPYVGKKLTVIAWLWARTVKSPDPAFAHVDVPLVSTFMLSTKPGKEVYIEPVVASDAYRFVVRVGKPKDIEAAKNGTKRGRGANFNCIVSGAPIGGDYIKAEGRSGRMGARLMAVVAEGERGRVYLGASEAQVAVTRDCGEPQWKPEGDVPARLTGGTCVPYGLRQWADLFTPRQLVALTTFSDLVAEARARVQKDAEAAGMPANGPGLEAGGTSAAAYADAVAVYLGLAQSRAADYNSSISTWRPKDAAMRSSLAKQAIPMTWDFAEASVFGDSSSDFRQCVEVVSKVIAIATAAVGFGTVAQTDAASLSQSPGGYLISTDPPYYDNVGYADLADFFYTWLRRSLKPFFPALFATTATPKADELVATPYRHRGKNNAERWFRDGMTKALRNLGAQSHPAFPVTIYYAFKQSEIEGDEGVTNTGWAAFLVGVVRAGLSIAATWPLRTEGDNRQTGIGANALASSIVLACRPRIENAPTATRREFLNALKRELPPPLKLLQASKIAPVDVAQAAIGPGMAIYTRYARVLNADGSAVSVSEALMLINRASDEILGEKEGDFDTDTRWALVWFYQFGFGEGDFGTAEMLSKAKNTSVDGLVHAGILSSKSGRVRLLKAEELDADWNPATDSRLTTWEIVHHLIRVLGKGGETAAAALVARLGANADVARQLAYRLYAICEQKKRATEALTYNSLVQSWPEIDRLARQVPTASQQAAMFAERAADG